MCTDRSAGLLIYRKQLQAGRFARPPGFQRPNYILRAKNDEPALWLTSRETYRLVSIYFNYVLGFYTNYPRFHLLLKNHQEHIFIIYYCGKKLSVEAFFTFYYGKELQWKFTVNVNIYVCMFINTLAAMK